jgi:opacity protein-like surface antigen
LKSNLFLLVVASALPVAFGQSFEASVSGGVSRLTNNVLGPDILSPGAAAGSNVKLNDGFRLGFRMGFNTYSHFGFEFGYAYNRTHLHLDGPPVTELGMAIHQGFGDALLYVTPEKARIRPFVAGGVHFSNFVQPGASAQYGQGQNKFGVNYGGGIKVRVATNWQIRFDFRQYETGKPDFGVFRPSGQLLQNEISVGVGFVL